MLTHCPSCATHFRVTPAQLKQRAGTVRCGKCSFVFNALDSLADDPASAMTEATPTAEADQVVPPVREADARSGVDVVESSVTEEGGSDPWVRTDTAPEASAETFEPELEQAAEETLEPPSLVDDYLAEPLLHETAMPPRRWPWVVGSVVAVLGLLLQMAYYYRVELAVLRPDWRPMLLAACKPLHCDVPRPRNIDSLGIDTSDLRPDPQQPGHLMLNATLRSKAPFAQEWPVLELTLTDVADRKLAVKDFAAADYLPKDKATAAMLVAGFPANGEIAVSLPLDIGDIAAAGYRLYVFYP